MGKKGKKKSKPKPSLGGGDREQQRTMIEQLGGLNLNREEKATPDDVACYFCLDEGPDEKGKPVVRDCSCRGNDAGFAHLSCMIKYAEQKSKSLVGKSNFAGPWYECLSCKQPFKDQLALAMTSAFISFTESTYGHPRQSLDDKMCVMIALRSRIVTTIDCQKAYIMNNPHKWRMVEDVVPVDEANVLSNKLLSMVEQIKEKEQMTYWQLKALCCDFEARTYNYLGVLKMMKGSTEECIAYYEKTRDIYELFGVKDEAKAAQNAINLMRAPSESFFTENVKSVYEYNIEKNGLTSEHTMRFGLGYVEHLLEMHFCIEAERLAMKLAADSRRVHGPEHNCTVRADVLLTKCKKRFVMHDKKKFEALRYEDDRETCVITGPVTEPRQADKETILRVACCQIVPSLGCTVVCTGLVSSPHINGKLGDVRDGKLVGNVLRLDVHFEDAKVKPARVRPENLRIAFELLSKDAADNNCAN
jgi:hypothetical protein